MVEATAIAEPMMCHDPLFAKTKSPSTAIMIPIVEVMESESLRKSTPPAVAASAPAPRTIGYDIEKSPRSYARDSNIKYGTCVAPLMSAHFQAISGIEVESVQTKSATALSAPPIVNWPHNASLRSVLCLTMRFQEACSTAANRASTVARSTLEG